MHHISLLTILLLSLTAIFAGIVDTLAGGGGLITIPALLGAGLPPLLTLGTNRFQGCVGELNATLNFMRHGGIRFKEIRNGIFFTAIGTTIGTWVIQFIHPEILKKLIPFLLVCVLIYIIFSPRPTDFHAHAKKRMTDTKFYIIFGLLIGFYNGFLGPPTGTLWAIAFMFFLSFDIKNATMHTKPLNFTGNFISLFWFIIGGHVLYSVAISMAIGQIIGSKIGSILVIKGGNKLIRPVFITVVSFMTLDVLIKAFVL